MSTSYRNPVYPGYFADPFVLRAPGGYLAFGTGRFVSAGSLRARSDACLLGVVGRRAHAGETRAPVATGSWADVDNERAWSLSKAADAGPRAPP